MARSNRKISRALLLVFLIVILVGAISLPTVHADEDGTAAAVAVDEADEETLDMDEPDPVKDEEPTAVVEEVKEDTPAAVEEVVVVEEEVEEEVPEPVTEKEDEEVEEEPEPVVVEEVMEEEVVEAVEEESVEEAVEEEPIESTETTEVAEETTSRKLSIPFFSKLTKQNAKKIAAFSLGAWGAATGVGWAMQQFGGESD